MPSIPTTRHELDAKDAEFSIKRVTVFSDRAEVVRNVCLSLTPGQHAIVMSHLSTSMDTDSIRVESACQQVIIQDVSDRIRWDKVKEQGLEVVEEEDASVNAKVKMLRKKVKEVELDVAQVHRDQSLLEDFAAHFGHAQQSSKMSKKMSAETSAEAASPTGVLDVKALAAFQTFQSEYASRGRDLAMRLTNLEQELEKARQELRTMESLQPHTIREEQSREVTILVEAKEETEFAFHLAYVIHGAGWSPKYDIRVLANTDEPELQLIYQAEIKQSTQESWDDVELALSTAQPSLGGVAPDLSVWRIAISERRFFSKSKMSSTAPGGYASKPRPRSTVFGRLQNEDEVTMEGGEAEGMAGMTFTIPSRATIPSDNAPHKVTVTVIVMSPVFNYVTCPKTSTHAYLKARVKNDSEYALLPGPASIFLDNSFVAKSTLKNVSPQEFFECSLGVDPAVRIGYPPRVRKQQTTGLLSRQVTVKTTQGISIKNTRSKPIVVQVQDQIPISQEERCKVTVVEPTLLADQIAGSANATTTLKGKRSMIEGDQERNEKGELRITGGEAPKWIPDTGVAEWVIKVPPGQESVIRYTFDVTYPFGEDIDNL